MIACRLAACRRVLGIARSLVPYAYRDLLSANAALYRNFALALLDEGALVLPDATLAAAERAAN